MATTGERQVNADAGGGRHASSSSSSEPSRPAKKRILADESRMCAYAACRKPGAALKCGRCKWCTAARHARSCTGARVVATARPSAAQHPNLDSHCRNTNRRPLVWPVEDGMPGTATGAPATAPSVSRQTVTSSSEAVAAAGTELDFGPSISPGHRVPPLPTEVLRGCEDNQRDRMVGGDHGVLCGSHTCRQRAGMCGGECSED